MKLQVVRVEDGKIETITVVPPATILVGTSLWHIASADGTDHYFNQDTGTYDGWGRAVNAEGTPENILDIVKDIDSQREIL